MASPAVENTRSTGVEDAGIAKISVAMAARVGYMCSHSVQNVMGSTLSVTMWVVLRYRSNSSCPGGVE